ncbi:MAG: hypothetical protein VX050_02065 [Planctomycetota bacterium]|nr:hypothetical protein [Planctomycetota bacterium]
MVNEPSSITTEPTEFALEGHRPCQHCGYDLVGTPIERARDLDLSVIRCPECGNLNPLIGTPPLGPFAQRAATAGTLIRLLLVGIAAILLWNVAFFSVEALGVSMYRGHSNDALMSFFQSAGDTPEEQRALENLRESDATLADVITVLTLFQERNDVKLTSTKLFQSQIKDLLLSAFFLGLVWSWLLLPQGWRRAGMLTLIVGLLAAGAGVASLYANNPLSLPAQDPRPIGAYVPDNWLSVMAQTGLRRMYALHGAALTVGTLMISSLLARPLARGAFRLLVPIEHLSGVKLLWTADGLPAPTSPSGKTPKVADA